MSMTNGVADGKWVFVNGNNTPRLARIDLTTFRTAEIFQIVAVTIALRLEQKTLNILLQEPALVFREMMLMGMCQLIPTKKTLKGILAL